MRAVETAARLAAFPGRGAGTDAERRAAQWLAGEIRSGRREALIQTFWCRPNWPLAQFWHCVLAIGGSLVMVHHPRVGGGLLLAALACIAVDRATGISPGRRLTRERASQNVVSPAPAPGGAPTQARAVRLIVTAHYDTGRTGLVYRTALRAGAALLRRAAGRGRLTPGWLGWLAIELLWLVAVAVLRDGGTAGTAIGIAQLIPTAALVIEAALLLELAQSLFGPGAGDNGSGVGVALDLVRALDVAPPQHLSVELVLQGAGDGEMLGLRRHLRTHRRELRPAETVVLGIGPCGAGRPCWWVSDGPLVPLRYHARLRRLARDAARSSAPSGPAGAPGTTPAAVAHRGRGTGPALPARTRGLPALTIGCVDHRGLAPRSHQAGDTPAALEPAAADALLELALTLVDALDADLAARGRTAASATAPAAA